MLVFHRFVERGVEEGLNFFEEHGDIGVLLLNGLDNFESHRINITFSYPSFAYVIKVFNKSYKSYMFFFICLNVFQNIEE